LDRIIETLNVHGTTGETIVGAQLQQGDHFPSLSFEFAGGETITFPDDISTRYAIVIFFRGHW